MNNGALSGGVIAVTPDPACIGDTITFTLSGVVDSGGTKRVDCVQVSIPAVTPSYTWDLTVPPDYPPPLPSLTGSGSVVTVVAKVPGAYSVTFTATANRECQPPDITIGPATASVPDDYDTVEIRYKTFIACNAIQTDPNPFLYDYFKGDNRNFSFPGGPSRTYLNFKATVDPSIATGQVGAVAKQFGQTRGYDNEGNNNDINPCFLGVCDSYCEFCISPTATAECTETAQFGVGGNVLDANY